MVFEKLIVQLDMISIDEFLKKGFGGSITNLFGKNPQCNVGCTPAGLN